MSNQYKILEKIPHFPIENERFQSIERFDLFKLGTFKVNQSIINKHNPNLSTQSTEEIVELVELQENTVYHPHFHEHSSAVIYMVIGEGTLILDQNQMPYQPGMRLDIPAKSAHGFITKTKTLFLSIQSPPIHDYETGTVDIHYV
ncbi:MAG TPA: cupin domain-containing protein [Legionella sp.]|nr:cupin domain-containing protein [Legionella sp.]